MDRGRTYRYAYSVGIGRSWLCIGQSRRQKAELHCAGSPALLDHLAGFGMVTMSWS